MNERPGFFARMGHFLAGKGFYMVLLGCLAALGLSGYYLWSTVTDLTETTPAGGDAQVETQVETQGEAVLPQKDVTVVTPPIQVVQPQPEPQPEPEVVEEEPEEVILPDPPQPQTVTYTLLWPVEGEVTAAFSATELTYHPVLGDWRTHDGVDLAADLGTEVQAAETGTVTQIVRQPATGTTLTLSHEHGLETVYGNLDPDTLTVAVGDRVSAGDILGCVGATGDGTQPCLHFSVLQEGESVDPMEFLE